MWVGVGVDFSKPESESESESLKSSRLHSPGIRYIIFSIPNVVYIVNSLYFILLQLSLWGSNSEKYRYGYTYNVYRCVIFSGHCCRHGHSPH